MKTLLYISVCLFAVTLCACDNDAHKNENGLLVSLAMPTSDAVENLRLWVYQADGLLVGEYDYPTYKSLAKTVLPLPAGDYVLISANNFVTPFSTDLAVANGAKPYELLIFQLDDPSASPAHAHYGVQRVTVPADKLVRTEVPMNRILAELQFTIKGIVPEVIGVAIDVENTSESFLPYSSQLLPRIATASLGRVAPQNGVASFPLCRLMPTVQLPSDREHVSHFTITFFYADGRTVTAPATAPAMANGGIYLPEIEFNILRPGISIALTTINGWRIGTTVEGEILNPTL